MIHIGDSRTVVDPETLPARLKSAGLDREPGFVQPQRVIGAGAMETFSVPRVDRLGVGRPRTTGGDPTSGIQGMGSSIVVPPLG